MIAQTERHAIVDEEHLRLLPVFYWVTGAITGFLSLYFVVYIGMGVLFALLPWESLVVAGITCFWVPYGTVLGVATFLVLLRPSVAGLFGDSRAAAPQPPPITARDVGAPSEKAGQGR
jgi:hypothetical protein